MSSHGDRTRAWRAMMRSRISICGLLAVPPVQYLDVRVRDSGRDNAKVAGALISVYPRLQNNQLANPPVAPIFQGWTDDLGDIIIRLPEGAYSVRTKKEWHSPELAWVRIVNLNESENTTVNFNMHHLRFYLHVDANRDGEVDDWPESIDAPAPAWEWGADGRGAIIPVNVDNDNNNANNDGDQEDNVINGVNDQDSDIARIEVRRQGGNNPVPITWAAALEIRYPNPAGESRGNPEDNARIFDDVAVGANRLVGPGVQQAPVPLPANNKALGMEATRYAGHDFEGVVVVRLTVTRPNGFGGNTSYMSEAQMRAASWIMPNHLDRADTVYVCRLDNAGESNAFINALDPLVTNAPPNGGGCQPLEEMDQTLVAVRDQDVWMQDCMELGYSTWPGAIDHNGAQTGILRMESVMRAMRDGELEDYPQTRRGVNFGYTFPGQGGNGYNTFNSTGNLEVTPPARATGLAANNAGPKDYNWGRIYFGRGRPGSPFNRATKRFLKRQGVQNPIELNTDWLNVGHVDEMMTFVPTPNGNKPWKLLIASPQDAYDILGDINTATIVGGTANDDVLGDAVTPRQLWFEVWRARATNNANDWRRREVSLDVNTTVGAMLGNGNSPIPKPDSPRPLIAPANIGDLSYQPFTWQEIREWNLNGIQPILDQIVTDLQQEISLHPVLDVIRIPIVFFPVAKDVGVPQLVDRIDNGQAATPINTIPGRTGSYRAGALTAGMVNMLVINNTLVIPQPFGPVTNGVDQFWDQLETRLTNANNQLNPQSIDDWNLYHAGEGEVHCGTNTLRKPANMNAWLQSNAAKWWEYPG